MLPFGAQDSCNVARMARAKSLWTRGRVQSSDAKNDVIFHNTNGMHVYRGVTHSADDLFHPRARFGKQNLVVVKIFTERLLSRKWPLNRNTIDHRDGAEVVENQVHHSMAFTFADVDRLDLLA